MEINIRKTGGVTFQDLGAHDKNHWGFNYIGPASFYILIDVWSRGLDGSIGLYFYCIM